MNQQLEMCLKEPPELADGSGQGQSWVLWSRFSSL